MAKRYHVMGVNFTYQVPGFRLFQATFIYLYNQLTWNKWIVSWNWNALLIVIGLIEFVFSSIWSWPMATSRKCGGGFSTPTRRSVKRSSAAALMQFQGISLSDLDRGELDPRRKIGTFCCFSFVFALAGIVIIWPCLILLDHWHWYFCVLALNVTVTLSINVAHAWIVPLQG